MRFIRPALLGFLLLTVVAGCASTPSHISTDSAHQIDPIRKTRASSTGWIVARVTGNPRNIQYYLNGVLLEPEEPIEWWKDAYVRIQLRPGFYDLQAQYSVRAFDGRGIEYLISSRQPIEVLPGQETEIEANLEKDWRGVPATDNAYFVPTTEQRRAMKTPTQEDAWEDTAPATKAWPGISQPVQRNPAATPEMIEEIRRVDAMAAAAVADQIVIHGNKCNVTAGTVRIETANQPLQQGEGTDNIVIRGTPDGLSATSGATTGAGNIAISSSGSTAPAIGAAAATTLLVNNATSAAQPVTLEGAEDFGITVTIESIPAGADVIVDEQRVGQSPVQVRLDPRADHIIEFEREGCGDYVRLLSSNSWRNGRDTTLQVQLYCD